MEHLMVVLLVKKKKSFVFNDYKLPFKHLLNAFMMLKCNCGFQKPRTILICLKLNVKFIQNYCQ